MRAIILLMLLCASAATADVRPNGSADIRLADSSEYRQPEQLTQLVQAENTLVEDFLASEKHLGQRIAHEIQERRAQSDRRQYWQVNGVSYRKTPAGKYFRVERFDARSAAWTLVIDAQQRAREKADALQNDKAQPRGAGNYYMLRTPIISPDNRYALLAEDHQGNEVYELSVWDIAAHRQIGKPIAQVTGKQVWAADSRHFY